MMVMERSGFGRFSVLVVVVLTVVVVAGSPAVAGPTVTLVDGTTPGYYNDALGTILDQTNPYAGNYLFPGADLADGDPVIASAPEPDLTVAASILGDWLGNPASLNSYWTGPQLIPSSWPLNDEVAIVYGIDAGPAGLATLTVEVGSDNGAFIWFDGVYQLGGLAPGHAYLGEFTVNLTDITPGGHYLQILLEDHGVLSDYVVCVSGVANSPVVPAPGAVLLGGLGTVLVTWLRRRRAI